MGIDNIDHTGVPLFDDSSCGDMIIGYSTECQECGAETIIYATHEIPVCAECAAMGCSVTRKRLDYE